MGKTKTKSSPVWQFFDSCESGKVRCTLCAAVLSYSGSTGTMINHLKYKHKSHSLSASSSDTSQSVNLKQTRISAYRAPVITQGSDRWRLCAQRMAEWCAIDMRPLSIGDGVGFRRFMSVAAPGFEPPKRTTVTKYLDKQYNEHKASLQEVLKKQQGIALTTDMWSSNANEAYITLTCHFLDDDWKLQNYVLSTKATDERHTGENIALDIRSIVYSFGIISDQICGLVTDNAKNMISCAKFLEEYDHIPCFAHSLQLSLRAGLDNTPAVSRAIGACKRVVAHFKRSVLASVELRKRQKQMDIAEHTLLIDCPTRWNSTYLMMDRLIEQRLPIYAVLSDESVTKKKDAATIDMADSNWKVVENIVTALKPFYKATTALCSEQYPTLSSVYPVVFSLLHHHLVDHDDDRGAVAQFKQITRSQLKTRFNIDDPDMPRCTIILSAFMDPRYKRMPFITREQYEHTITEISNRAEHLSSSDQVINNPSNTEGDRACAAAPSDQKHSDMSYLLAGYYEPGDCKVIVPNTVAEEVELYVKEKPIPTDSDPFKWWSKNATSYPKLSKLARRLLCIPGTEVPSERVFSTAGNVVTKKRASLHHDSVDKLVFLNKYFKASGMLNDDKPDPCKSDQQPFQCKQEPAEMAAACTVEPHNPISNSMDMECSSSSAVSTMVMPKLPQL